MRKLSKKFSSFFQLSFQAVPALGPLFLALILCSCANNKGKKANDQNGGWIGTWSTSQQLVEPRNMPPEPGLKGNTLRQIMHVSIGGDSLKVNFSNTFGTTPVTLNAVQIAASVDSSVIDSTTGKALSFGGKPGVIIPPDSTVTSDPFYFALKAQSNVAITIYYGDISPNVTGHPGSRTTSYLLRGNQVTATDFNDSAQMNHWYTIRSIEVMAPESAASVVVLGNSITDGRSSGINKQARWTDYLARRLQANPDTRDISVLNEGIGGNCILHGCLGPTALSRFHRDVINRPKVKWLIILEGINDIGGLRNNEDAALFTDRLIDSYKWMINVAHAHDIKVIGGTMTPFGGSFYDSPAHRKAWQKLNEWIRNDGHFDTVIDFDAVIHDPDQPMQLLPEADSGDHLHPGPLGYEMMAKAINLSIFK